MLVNERAFGPAQLYWANPQKKKKVKIHLKLHLHTPRWLKMADVPDAGGKFAWTDVA